MGDGRDGTDAPPDEIIPASRELGEKCLRPGNASLAALQAIASAEAALQELSVNFEQWMDEEVKQLHDARLALRGSDQAETASDILFAVAHNLKGHAATFGYPDAADICASLCRLMEAFTESSRLPLPLVDHHVDAVRAIVRETATGGEAKDADELCEHLRRATDRVIARAG